MGVDARMIVKTTRPLTAEQVLSLAADCVEAFGTDGLWVNRDGRIFAARHALTIVDGDYSQDGEPIQQRPGEQIIEAHLWGRYYGVGYERGDLPFYISLAGWLERRIPEGVVYYGGDSSGICAEPFGADARERLFAHFCAVGHVPYDSAFDRGVAKPKEAWCDFCKRWMGQYGFGATYAAYSCHGCDWRAETHDGGKTWRLGDADEMRREDNDKRKKEAAPVTP